MCKTKVLTYLHYNKNKNVNIKITKQDYGTKLYFKLMLNKLKVIGGPLKEGFMEVSHVFINQGNFLKFFLTITISELRINCESIQN